MVLVVRSPRSDALLQELPVVVESLDPEQAVARRRRMEDAVAESIETKRYVALVLAVFAAAALLLATLGIFGLVSYATSQRTRELGIRMALGSTPDGVVRLVMKDGLRLLGLGLGLGLAGALLVGRLLASRILGVSAFDLPVYAAIPAILGAAGLVASLLPAWRAVRIPPAIALRYE
jgi:putative ABC transport system permease protein